MISYFVSTKMAAIYIYNVHWFCTHSLFFVLMLNSAPFGLKICSEVSTAFVFNSQAEFLIFLHFEHLLETQDVVLTLEGALATFISKEVLVLSLSGGEL